MPDLRMAALTESNPKEARKAQSSMSKSGAKTNKLVTTSELWPTSLHQQHQPQQQQQQPPSINARTIPKDVLSKLMKHNSNNLTTTNSQKPSTPPSNRPSSPSKTTALNYAPDNAFVNNNTKVRFAHLASKNQHNKIEPDEFTFVYEADQQIPGAAPLKYLGSQQERGEERNSKGVHAIEFQVVSPVKETNDLEALENQGYNAHLSLKPSTRKEVILLKETMMEMLQNIEQEDSNAEYPTEMHAFLHVMQEEQKIYDGVFQELVRQVTVNMIERGEVLSEIRNRYSNMFQKIPKHVKTLFTELVAQRKLNKRLAEELWRTKDTAADLLRELDIIKKHDVESSKQAQDAQEKLVTILTQTDNTEEILEEYHKLYKLQKDRLEDAVRVCEMEKRVWVDAAINLALRLGEDQGVIDMLGLQRDENARLRTASDITLSISQTNEIMMKALQKKVEDWRQKVLHISTSVVEDDQATIESLTKMQKNMRQVLKNMVNVEPSGMLADDHPVMQVFHLYDIRTLAGHLMAYVQHMNTVATRFTGDRDVALMDEIRLVRQLTEGWIEAGIKLLKRHEKTTNGYEFKMLLEDLTKIDGSIHGWMTKLERRISGDDGLATQVISLQNSLEDRYTTYSARDFNRSLPQSERKVLSDSLRQWVDQVTSILSTHAHFYNVSHPLRFLNFSLVIIGKASDKEQRRIPSHVEGWMSKILDRMETDTDIRSEENIKLHNQAVNWVVQLLVKSAKERPSPSWDQDFYLLQQSVSS